MEDKVDKIREILMELHYEDDGKGIPHHQEWGTDFICTLAEDNDAADDILEVLDEYKRTEFDDAINDIFEELVDTGEGQSKE